MLLLTLLIIQQLKLFFTQLLIFPLSTNSKLLFIKLLNYLLHLSYSPYYKMKDVEVSKENDARAMRTA